ncbi:GNAT family N-acetyltransferase [Flavobacterium sp. MXW15]|uniref:GNAT family N-acetyltransferase n=1 Tax=Xanthomonas chitinilytica TaxID=2989819 RepID=A0ABT3JTU2_9XANT|nr:GNAT family protein [Xanthomonas sp. H13-6]MCW4454669.1 GNAT family N-acetyltransferase [Flavobacterium sp. MXW15]MCW4471908.1 GNAT family N-acetyltransferase [Xanthomonas sp. H13-6]
MQTRLPQPELHGPRLRLREVREDDAPALFAIHSDPQVMRYWSHPAWTDPVQAEQKVADIQRQRRELDILVWAIADAASDRLIGTGVVFALDPAQGRAEIGYSLHPDWQGRGLASEALRMILAYLFEELQLRRVEADVDPRNEASWRLLEKLGFVREGMLRERWHVNGELCDTALYGLLRRDFPAR